MIKPGIYKHYKGEEKQYEVLYLAKNANDDSNPDNIVVIYKQLYDAPGYPKNTIWARDLREFEGEVEVNGVKVKRYLKVS